MDKPLKPQFYVTRPNGDLIPLIAMDELPLDMRIHGVARKLSQSRASIMIGIGKYNRRGGYHPVELLDLNDHTKSKKEQKCSPPGSAKRDEPDHPQSAHTSVKDQDLIAKSLRNEQATFQTLDSVTRARIVHNHDEQSVLHPKKDSFELRSLPGIKEYCSYWLRRGECDYAQQGCIYKHEMPHDQAALLRLGFRDIPRWYREKHGLESLLSETAISKSVQSKHRTKARKKETRNAGNHEEKDLQTFKRQPRKMKRHRRNSLLELHNQPQPTLQLQPTLDQHVLEQNINESRTDTMQQNDDQNKSRQSRVMEVVTNSATKSVPQLPNTLAIPNLDDDQDLLIEL